MIRKHIILPTKKWFKKKVQNVYIEMESKKPVEPVPVPVKDNSKIIYLQYNNGDDYFLIPSEKEEFEVPELTETEL